MTETWSTDKTKWETGTVKYEFVELTNPERSDWECELFGLGRSIVVTPIKGNEPNWFWRQMQWLLVGNRWGKRK